MMQRAVFAGVVLLCLMGITTAVFLDSVYTEGCTKDNCNNCQDESLQCTNCTWGWTLRNNRVGCIACDSNCKYCSQTGNTEVTKCYECYQSYRLTSNKECTPCTISNCLQCEVRGNVETCLDCSSGYALNEIDGSECHACDTGCVSCAFKAANANYPNRGTCTQCAALMYREYSTSNDLDNCGSCPVGCATCSETRDPTLGTTTVSCGTCIDRYTSNGATCSACSSSCLACNWNDGTTQTECTTCSATTYLATTVCNSCGNNCDVCEETAARCADCSVGYRLSSGACIACPSHCDECEESNGVITCSQCQARWTEKTIALSDMTCDDCPNNCLTCTDNVCISCVTSYVVNGGICTKCPSNCHSCSMVAGSAECDATGCDVGFVQNSNTGTCLACPANCEHSACTFDVANSWSLCSACIQYPSVYAPDVDTRNCLLCDSNCAETGCAWTAGTSTLDCTTCVAYFESSATFACEACPANCPACTLNAGYLDCDASACDTTFTHGARGGGGADTAQVICHACIDHCDTCAFATITVCDACTSAGVGYVADAAATTCHACPANCGTCTIDGTDSFGICTTCAAGYGESADTLTCIKCSTGCDDCALNAASQMVCSSAAWCATGYTHDTSTLEHCRACPSFCGTCTWDNSLSRTTCDVGACTTGYAYRDDGNCVPCPVNCPTCTLTSGLLDEVADICDSCSSYYVLEAGQCLACPTHCESCSYSTTFSKTTCDTCFYQYDTVPSTTNVFYGECSVCSRYCASCTTNTNSDNTDPTECNICINRYELDDRYCAICPFHCAECTIDDSARTTQCTLCDTYYTIGDLGQCASCPSNCQTCSKDGSCSQCDTGYGISQDSKSCVLCNDLTDVEFCQYCTDFDQNVASTCLSCFGGYKLNDNSTHCHDTSQLRDCNLECDDPPPMCKECTSPWNQNPFGDCEMVCKVCGNLDDMRPESECNAGGNYTEMPFVGEHFVCTAIFREHLDTGAITVARGAFHNYTCASGSMEGETCRKVDGYKECHKCCGEQRCNSYTLHGWNAAPYLHGSLWVLMVMLVASIHNRL